MLLANSCVSGKAATGHVLMYAPTGGFPRILALHPKSLRQIGNLWFSERTPEVLTNLPWEVRFFCGERGGDRSIGEANLRKGAALQWLAHLAPVRGVAPSMEAAPPPALALHPKWIRSLGCAGRNPRCSHPCGVKCQRILSFPKTLFYSLAALRRKSGKFLKWNPSAHF